MTNLPFGFGNRPGDDDPVPSPQDPFAAMFGAGGGADLGAAFTRLGQLLSWTGGPVNWDLARDIARQAAAGGGDPSIAAPVRSEVAEALRLAEVWLDSATTLPSAATRAVAWSRAEWLESTLPGWKPLVDPVAARVVEAMGNALTQQIPAEMQAMAGTFAPMMTMMGSMGGALFGAQIGHALGSLASEVFGSTDIGLPLGPAGQTALLPSNVSAFGAGLSVPQDQVRLYLALREAAHLRLYAHSPWLRDRLISEITRYAQEIRIDTTRIEQAVSRLDPSDPASMQEALGGGLFEPEHTPEQQRVLARLEGLLALVEGWVDEVVDAAATPYLPTAAALREAVRRRRATGGPAEQTFASLVGLELRPRRSREAAALWRALLEARGAQGRDAVWNHPDYLPTVEDLDDPQGFAAGEPTQLDLSALTERSTGSDTSGGRTQGPSQSSGEQQSGEQQPPEQQSGEQPPDRTKPDQPRPDQSRGDYRE